jgi:hypothetical protein
MVAMLNLFLGKRQEIILEEGVEKFLSHLSMARAVKPLGSQRRFSTPCR